MDGDGLVLNPPDDHDALVLGRLHVQGDDDLLLLRALLVSVCVGVLVLVLVCGAGASPVTVLMVKRGCAPASCLVILLFQKLFGERCPSCYFMRTSWGCYLIWKAPTATRRTCYVAVLSGNAIMTLQNATLMIALKHLLEKSSASK